MTVFNTIAKIGRRLCSELENLSISTLEQSLVEEKIKSFVRILRPDGNENTIEHIGRRTCSELEGLKMCILEESKISNNLASNIECNSSFDEGNTIGHISRRTYGELTGLYMHIIHNSFRTFNSKILRKFIVVRPSKIYTRTLKIIRTYKQYLRR